MSIVGSEILTFNENGIWVACWRRKYVLSQGLTENQAIIGLYEAIGLNEVYGRGTFFAAIPDGYVERWERQHKESHK